MELIGNSEVFILLEIAVKAALIQSRSIPHMLLCGAPGCGKTSTAKFVAERLGSDFLVLAAGAIKSRQEVLDLVERLNHYGYTKEGARIVSLPIIPTILFIDEIHNVSLQAQEWLGILMEEWYFPLTDSEAQLAQIEAAKNRRLRKSAFIQGKPKTYKRWCPLFTLIGATTNDGKLSKPFRDRFKLRFNFQPYTLEESVLIALSHAKEMNITLDEMAAKEIAKRGRGVPRIIVRLLERCRDSALAVKSPLINSEITRVTFAMAKVDDSGLNETDIRLLKTLYEAKVPIGVEHLSIQLNESPQVIQEAVEPYLIQRGLILRTGKGRTLSVEGLEYLINRLHVKDNIDELEFVDIPMVFKT
jgi:Holliday junction DNA helicase RuvB